MKSVSVSSSETESIQLQYFFSCYQR